MKANDALVDKKTTKRSLHAQVTDQILEHLSKGVIPWKKPWRPMVGAPRNFDTGNYYRGINIFLLGFAGYDSPWWMTYRQAQAKGGYVRKGSRGVRIVKYGQLSSPQKDGAGDQSPADSETDERSRSRYYMKSFTVFNAAQIEGIEFPNTDDGKSLSEDQRIRQAEDVVTNMPSCPTFHESRRSRACYSLASDIVEVPLFATFDNPEAYYSTLFHELIHATGHQSRLARPSLLSLKRFGDHEYSKEELVAEMGSAILCAEIGIANDDETRSSAAYIQSWLDALKVREHQNWVVGAANQASKAVDFVLDRKNQQAVVH